MAPLPLVFPRLPGLAALHTQLCLGGVMDSPMVPKDGAQDGLKLGHRLLDFLQWYAAAPKCRTATAVARTNP